MTIAIDDIFSASADPDNASRNFQTFCENYFKSTGREFHAHQNNLRLLKIFGNSHYLSLFLIRNPDVADTLESTTHLDREKHSQEFAAEVQDVLSKDDGELNLLKKYKYQEMTRLTIKELCLMDQESIYRELSHLAIHITSAISKKIYHELLMKYQVSTTDTGHYALLSMGKLGGHEVNYSSDLDLIGFYEAEKNHGTVTNHEFFSKLFRKLGQTLQHNNENGFFFRIDWDLRPEGKSGVLANSLVAMETYYETFGQDWERQAFIRAHVLFETGNLGSRFLKYMQPFVYRKSLDPAALKGIRDIKSRIHTEQEMRRENGFDVKRDRGGIREIEFFIQTLQLVFAGKDASLRSPNTFAALRKLHQKKIISDKDYTFLDEAYRFMRRLESSLQMENEQQTHLLHHDPVLQLKSARRMGLVDESDISLNHLRDQINHYRNEMMRLSGELYAG